MSEYNRFEINEDFIRTLRRTREIPAHLYSEDGQILIYRKQQSTDEEIERLLKFASQREIFYDVNDSVALGIRPRIREVPEGLSDTKLLSEQAAAELAEDTKELFSQLRFTTITSVHTKKAGERLDQMLSDFENQPDAMNGLVNIIDIMSSKKNDHEIELAVKRTVVAMAMKTRGLNANTAQHQESMRSSVNNLMLSALLCDIGCVKMKMPDGTSLTVEEMNYIRNHPMMSYLMLAHETGIDPLVKRNILSHHRPLKDIGKNNNYPSAKWMLQKLVTLHNAYVKDPTKILIARDIREQIALLNRDITYDEDANILAIASEFASLTSNVPWRPAFTGKEAVRLIINNSFFSYSSRIIREFLNYVAISLCDNQKIIWEGDYIVIASKDNDGKTHFEVCRVTDASRYQSHPGVDRYATIHPRFEEHPKMKLIDFDLESMKPDRRYAHFELSMDDSRQICYLIDPVSDKVLFDKLESMHRARNQKQTPPDEPIKPKA